MITLLIVLAVLAGVYFGIRPIADRVSRAFPELETVRRYVWPVSARSYTYCSGKREIARRKRQIAAGVIRIN